jgi:CRP/FNR family transcriptional regulator, cyclic AMP receptor protein
MLSKDEKKLFLRKTRLFGKAPDHVLNDLVEKIQVLEMPPGEMVFRKGDDGSCMYIIQQGKVKIHDGDLVFTHFLVGDVLGEMAALDPQARSASATTEEQTVLLRLDRKDILRVLSSDFSAVRAVIHVLSEHLRKSNIDMNRDFLYIQQVNQLTAAAQAIEVGEFNPESLNEVTERGDELGQLARVFQRMARQVYARENMLMAQVRELKISLDSVRQKRDVQEITSTDFFKDLKKKLDQLRPAQASGAAQSGGTAQTGEEEDERE